MKAPLIRRIAAEQRVLIVPLVAGFLLNVAVDALYVYPLRSEVRAVEQRANVAREALGSAERDDKDARDLVVGKERVKGELDKFYRDVLPADLVGARRITYVKLAQLARDSNLRYQRSVMDPRPAKDSTLDRLQITLVLEGTYESVRQFMYRLETGPEFIVIDNIALTQGSELDSPLVLTLSLSTYFRAGGDGS